MSYLARFSPFRAIRDLRLFLSYRQPHQLLFLALAIVLTTAIIAGFIHDSYEERPYKRDIVYVQQWPADRSDAQIVAQQKIDSVERHKQIAELQKRQAARQAEFKKIDDKLKAWGL
ncbi:MAG: hypothetical protein ACKVOB_03825 [Sphingomonas sp.]